MDDLVAAMREGWQHEGLPPSGLDVDAWLDDGSVRRVRSIEGELMFLDCNHPLQNVWCDHGRVVAWRAVGEHNFGLIRIDAKH